MFRQTSTLLTMPDFKQHIAIIIPAYNEAKSIALVVQDLQNLRSNYLDGPYCIDHIIVCDNASTDGTASLAQSAGATVVSERQQGYGAACLAGLDYLADQPLNQPNVVVFVDGDRSAIVTEMIHLLDEISNGADLVVGTRKNDLQQLNALGRHQRFGTWLASRLITLIWRQKVSDLGPFRAIRYNALRRIQMHDAGFGWTTEMQVKALQAKMHYSEVPVSTLARLGKSKISGTVRGTIGAALGIFGMIFSLYQQESEFVDSLTQKKTNH